LPSALHLCQKHSTYCIGGHCCAQVWNLQRLSISSHVPHLTALQKKGMLQTQHQCPQHRLGSCHLNKDSSKSPEKKNQIVWWRIKCMKEFWFQLPCSFSLKLFSFSSMSSTHRCLVTSSSIDKHQAKTFSRTSKNLGKTSSHRKLWW
jgi:hypothetical protein